MKNKYHLYSPVTYCFVLLFFIVLNISAQEIASPEAVDFAAYTKGILMGKDSSIPEKCDFKQQRSGENTLLAFVKVEDGMGYASEPVIIEAKNKIGAKLLKTWIDSVDTYTREVFMPANEYHWDWGQATMLRAMVNQYESKSDAEKQVYLDYIRTAMDKTYSVANGKHPNAVASGHGMAFLARITGEKKYREKAMEIYADYLTTPRVSNGGVSHRVETAELWDDTIYMLSMFFLEMYRLTDDEKYVAEFALQLKAHSEKLASNEWGLWFHGWDNDTIDYDDRCSMKGWSDKKTGRSQEFWGRGNGWIAMALADAMRIVPRESVYWKQFETEFRKFVARLPELQDKTSGHWYQLPIYPDNKLNYPESSCTAMFAYGLTVALRLNIIDENTYRPVVDRAYKGLKSYSLEKVDTKYLIPTQVCKGTCIGDKNYYLNRATLDGTHFGLGAFIMFGIAYNELK